MSEPAPCYICKKPWYGPGQCGCTPRESKSEDNTTEMEQLRLKLDREAKEGK